ncbi:MAG: biopolymer transporter ExbD [Nitrospirae bacterium]|nr:biopolymer transporter ExbD [Nitrospirota bacterium]
MIYVPSRVKRHKYKFRMDTGLNLVSLMDIFTTLVFFLLIHVSGEGESLQIPDIVSLPISTSTDRPAPAPVVYVTTDKILVGDKLIADAGDVLSSTEASIDSLEKELSSQAAGLKEDAKSKGKIIIMGDKTIPFTLLKKVMVSCSKAGYPVITLAVIQREGL